MTNSTIDKTKESRRNSAGPSLLFQRDRMNPAGIARSAPPEGLSRYRSRAASGWFNAPVPSFGPIDAQLLIIGLAPGLQGANRTGRPLPAISPATSYTERCSNWVSRGGHLKHGPTMD
jgi:uracil-DNA glycosylase